MKRVIKILEDKYGPWFEIKYAIYNFFYNFPGRWWFSHRFIPKHRYNIIRTGLKPGYYDPDTQMLYGIMKLFCDWYDTCHHLIKVEDFKDIKDEHSLTYLETNRSAFEEYKRIYDWWKLEVKGDVDSWIVSKVYEPDADKGDRWNWKLEESMQEEITNNLVSLMKLRSHFWY